MSAQADQHREGSAEPQDMFVIEALDGIKAIADPLRMRVLMEIASGRRTVKAIAASLGVPKTRLYYHVNLLERHGMIRVASRRVVSGIEERSYEAPYQGWTVAPSLLPDAIKGGLVEAIFNLARAELEVALEERSMQEGGFSPGDFDSNVPILNLTGSWMTREEIEELTTEFQNLFMRFRRDEPIPGATEYHGLFALYRTQLHRSDPETSSDAP